MPEHNLPIGREPNGARLIVAIIVVEEAGAVNTMAPYTIEDISGWSTGATGDGEAAAV